MTTIEQLENARLELSNVPEHLRHLYTNGIECIRLFRDAQNQTLVRLQLGSSGTPESPANAAHYVISELRGSGAVSDLPRLAVIADALSESPDFAEAQSACQPLVAKIAALASALADERRKADRAADDQRVAKEAAVSEAVAKIEAKFAA